ncbi:MAG: hypothetical protein AABX88_00830 [Nanoarchaeota archaeon]
MGTIVYTNLVELLLEDGNKTEYEMVEEAVKTFGFEDRSKLEHEIKFQLMMRSDEIIPVDGDKYKLTKLSDCSITGRKAFLDMLKDCSEDYFEVHPEIKKLKEVLETKIIK